MRNFISPKSYVLMLQICDLVFVKTLVYDQVIKFPIWKSLTDGRSCVKLSAKIALH
jgi:hypothetical protein